ncbi:MAG: PilT/PilU family type 4a pilus ATPase [Sandaracinus sp.]|nr:PilT/PilU family type 4a pilus ATPase [Sandaracinus sp.]
MDRQALRTFRDASWGSVDELRRYLESVDALKRSDVENLVAVLRDPSLPKDGPHHRNRCSAFKTMCLSAPDPSFFAPIVEALPAFDGIALKAAEAVLPRCNDTESHPALCKTLGNPNAEVRAAVKTVLEAVGGPSALRALTQLVRERTFLGRREAMDVMVPKARHRALDLLAGVVKTGTAAEQLEALRWLADGEVMSAAAEQALQIIQDALDVDDARVAGIACRAFAQAVDEARFFEVVEPRFQREDVQPGLVSALGAVSSPRTVALLRTRSRRGPTAVQLAALQALEEIGGESVIEAFMDALVLEDPMVQRAAAEGIGRLASSGRVDAARLLINVLRSPHEHVRSMAATFAARVRTDDRLGDAVLDATTEEDWWSRERVLDALVELGVPRLGERLVRHLDADSPMIRRFAVYGLLRLRDPQTLGALLHTAATDDDWWVREQAAQAMGELGDASAVPYLEILVRERPDLRVVALDALEQLRAHEVLMGLADLTTDEDPGVALAMLEILGRHPKGREAGFYVQAALGSTESYVSKKARELLAEWKLDATQGSASLGLLDRLLVAAERHGADDVLLSPGRPPYVKKLGSVEPIARASLGEKEVEAMILPLLRPGHRELLDRLQDVDLSYDVPGFDMRFRINVFRERNGLSAVFRRISQTIPEIESLGLPPVIKSFADYPNGLVLVGGPTGSGKSTTLAALIDYINTYHGRHIVTIEDPVEVVHRSKRGLVNQAEVGTHAESFPIALRGMLRQDPDVILVGELRDQATIEIAVNAAETGHLVFATVHTTSAAATIDRLVHSLPAGRQGLVRGMLAESLRAVLCQQLLKRIDEPGKRVLACEVMVNNDAIAHLVRNDKAYQIPSVILTHRDQGMQLMDGVLEDLVRAGAVDPEDALLKAVDKSAFSRVLDAARKGERSHASVAPPPTNSGLERFSVPPAGRAPSGAQPRTSFVPPRIPSGSGEKP